MKMVVGLGNPGKQYEGTRHNIGYEVLAELAKRYGVIGGVGSAGASRAQVKHEAELAEVMVAGEKVLLVSPLTFMNLSGRSVRPLMDFYKLSLDHLMVISDDLSLPTGQLRIKAKGSSGGQKGIQSIIQLLGTQEFPRLRIGIDPTPPRWSTSDYVLGKFSADQRPLVDLAVVKAADAVELWVREGITSCMNRYNVRPDPKPQKSKSQKVSPPSVSELGPEGSRDVETETGKSEQQ